MPAADLPPGICGSALLLPFHQGLAEALLHGTDRFDELELLAFGALAIDQLPTVGWRLGHPVRVGVAGSGLAVRFGHDPDGAVRPHLRHATASGFGLEV